MIIKSRRRNWTEEEFRKEAYEGLQTRPAGRSMGAEIEKILDRLEVIEESKMKARGLVTEEAMRVDRETKKS